MGERILSIDDYRGLPEARSWGAEAGFKITTTDQVVTLAIDDESCCCESWGYFLTEDDRAKFVGAELRGIAITDTNRSARIFLRSGTPWDAEGEHLDEGDVMFVDIETDRGVLQFVAYNAHNGYYGHSARVESKQLVHEVGL